VVRGGVRNDRHQLSGVTFISVPGYVDAKAWTYFQLVFGFAIGYWVVAGVLLPLYYRLQLTSIYGYLRERFGMRSYRTGASFFILSRLAGATIRIFVVLNVIQLFVLDAMGVPFEVTAFIGDGDDRALHAEGRREDHRVDGHAANRVHDRCVDRHHRLHHPAARAWAVGFLT
jgi:hypothetical protein